jgi:5-methylcytosine-specific restriction endonuclease McrA
VSDVLTLSQNLINYITPEEKVEKVEKIEKVEKVKNVKRKKKSIPKKIKTLSWNTYIGEEIGMTECLCCKTTKITQLNFHCGHIVSDKNGGSIKVNNLRPICAECNLSMGSKNMDEFMNEYGLGKLVM